MRLVDTTKSNSQLRKRFGQHLIDNNIVPAKIILKALDQQRKQQHTIGNLAYKEKLMTAEQIFEVLNKQQDNNLKFGEIAIQLGFLNNTQVVSLLNRQEQLRPKLGEILLQTNNIDQSTLNKELDVFLKR